MEIIGTKNILEKLYALRAGMSVLSSQYDKYYDICFSVQEIYKVHAQKFLNIAVTEKNDYPFKLYLGLRYDVIDCVSSTMQNVNGKRQPVYYLAYDGYHNMHKFDELRHWENLAFQKCYFALSSKEDSNKHYSQLDRLFESYHYKMIADCESEKQYKEWAESFESDVKKQCVEQCAKQELQDIEWVSGYVVSYKDLKYHCCCLIRDLVFGQWILTDEGLSHFRTKVKEHNELITLIQSDTEKLKPQGFFEKLFNRGKNVSKIAENEKMIGFGRIAVNNLAKSIEFMERENIKVKNAIEEKNRSIENLNSTCKQIYRALQDEYSTVLDSRDWQNIDLIIYFIETGRAYTIKEALQQVDMEKRTNHIIQTIRDATERICSTISIGFATLNDSITKCFAVLESRIAEQNILLQQQNTHILELVSTANMSNSLIAKQNVSSEKLMKDIKLLRDAVV